MIILDTNVLSEAIKVTPDPVVEKWLLSLPASSMFTTTITQAEMLYGLRILPHERRRDQLSNRINNLFDRAFAGRVLSFDAYAADAYASLAAHLRLSGKSMSQADAMIAGIVISRGAKFATRNMKDFVDSGIEVVDPWVG